MLKTIKLNKGVLLFYLVVALISMIYAIRINNLNIVGSSNTTSASTVHCA